MSDKPVYEIEDILSLRKNDVPPRYQEILDKSSAISNLYKEQKKQKVVYNAHLRAEQGNANAFQSSSSRANANQSVDQNLIEIKKSLNALTQQNKAKVCEKIEKEKDDSKIVEIFISSATSPNDEPEKSDIIFLAANLLSTIMDKRPSFKEMFMECIREETDKHFVFLEEKNIHKNICRNLCVWISYMFSYYQIDVNEYGSFLHRLTKLEDSFEFIVLALKISGKFIDGNICHGNLLEFQRLTYFYRWLDRQHNSGKKLPGSINFQYQELKRVRGLKWDDYDVIWARMKTNVTIRKSMSTGAISRPVMKSSEPIHKSMSTANNLNRVPARTCESTLLGINNGEDIRSHINYFIDTVDPHDFVEKVVSLLTKIDDEKIDDYIEQIVAVIAAYVQEKDYRNIKEDIRSSLVILNRITQECEDYWYFLHSMLSLLLENNIINEDDVFDIVNMNDIPEHFVYYILIQVFNNYDFVIQKIEERNNKAIDDVTLAKLFLHSDYNEYNKDAVLENLNYVPEGIDKAVYFISDVVALCVNETDYKNILKNFINNVAKVREIYRNIFDIVFKDALNLQNVSNMKEIESFIFDTFGTE